MKDNIKLLCVFFLVLFALVACGGDPTTKTGDHITKIQTGTGFDSHQNTVQGENNAFGVGETIYVVFTVKTTDNNALVTLKILHGGVLEDTSIPLTMQQGEHVYDKSIDIHAAGKYSIKAVYNNDDEASIDFSVN